METIKKDMLMLHVSEEMALNIAEWKKKIHVVDSKIWDKGFLVVVEDLCLYSNLWRSAV